MFFLFIYCSLKTMIWEIVYNFENFMAQIKWMEGKRDIYILDANMLLFFFIILPLLPLYLYTFKLFLKQHTDSCSIHFLFYLKSCNFQDYLNSKLFIYNCWKTEIVCVYWNAAVDICKCVHHLSELPLYNFNVHLNELSSAE